MLTELLDYEEWSEVNEQELSCIFAETGRNREACFDRAEDELFMYEHMETYANDYPQLIYYH